MVGEEKDKKRRNYTIYCDGRISKEDYEKTDDECTKEIERLKTEKLILLRNNLENQEKIESLTKKQESLEKGILNANREMKLLKIEKKSIF